MIVKSVTKKPRGGTWWFVAGLVLIIATGYTLYVFQSSNKAAAPENLKTVSENSNNISGSDAASQPQKSKDLAIEWPIKKTLSVPFTPQAPTANWDELHNEACEEASAIMANAYFSKMEESTLKPDYVESEINKLTDWQKENLGYYLDSTTKETARMIEKVYGLKTEVISFPEKEKIKEEIVKGNLVIVSANGRNLNNPYYKQPGPIHHMLVIIGYEENIFITNDPGTKRGLGYAYDYLTLKTAAADWDHSIHSVDNNKKIAIIISKP